jgi:hypothetical protein
VAHFALPVVDDDRRVVGIVSEADLLIKEGWPHGGDDAGVLETLRHRHRFGKGAGTCAAEVMTRGEPAAGVTVEVHDGTVTLIGQLERRSQVATLIRAVQAVPRVAAMTAKLAWETDDVAAMATWPVTQVRGGRHGLGAAGGLEPHGTARICQRTCGAQQVLGERWGGMRCRWSASTMIRRWLTRLAPSTASTTKVPCSDQRGSTLGPWGPGQSASTAPILCMVGVPVRCSCGHRSRSAVSAVAAA